jgi:hypothetical protein
MTTEQKRAHLLATLMPLVEGWTKETPHIAERCRRQLTDSTDEQLERLCEERFAGMIERAEAEAAQA